MRMCGVMILVIVRVRSAPTQGTTSRTCWHKGGGCFLLCVCVYVVCVSLFLFVFCVCRLYVYVYVFIL